MMQELPTFGELERNLNQKIYKLYKEELKHSPQKVTSKFFGNQLTIVIENALTKVEQILMNEHNEIQVVENLNSAINNAIKSKLKNIIETILAVEVEDILYTSTIETKRTGAIVILSQIPQVRSPKSLWKTPKIQYKNEHNGSQNERNGSQNEHNGSQTDNNFTLTMELAEKETPSE